MTNPTRSKCSFSAQRLNAIRRLTLALVTLLPFASLPAAAQQEEPVLRENITVYSDIVTLGDLFENADSVANIPVFRSPDTGQEGIVTSHRIAAAAHQHGLIWTNPGEINKVVVSRPSRQVTLDDFTKLVRERIASDLGIEDESALDIKLDEQTVPVHLNPRNTSPLSVQSLDYNNTSGSFRALIGFRVLSETQPNIVVRGRAIEMLEIPVPEQPIIRNQSITAEDIRVIRIARTRIRRGTALSADEIIGQAAKRRLAANRPVLRRDLEAPKLVKRNTMVEILFETGGLLLKAEGRALSDAAKGQAVKVLNTQTKRTVEGTAIATGVVSVASKSRSAALVSPAHRPRRITRNQAKQTTRANPWATRVVKAN